MNDMNGWNEERFNGYLPPVAPPSQEELENFNRFHKGQAWLYGIAGSLTVGLAGINAYDVIEQHEGDLRSEVPIDALLAGTMLGLSVHLGRKCLHHIRQSRIGN